MEGDADLQLTAQVLSHLAVDAAGLLLGGHVLQHGGHPPLQLQAARLRLQLPLLQLRQEPSVLSRQHLQLVLQQLHVMLQLKGRSPQGRVLSLQTHLLPHEPREAQLFFQILSGSSLRLGLQAREGHAQVPASAHLLQDTFWLLDRGPASRLDVPVTPKAPKEVGDQEDPQQWLSQGLCLADPGFQLLLPLCVHLPQPLFLLLLLLDSLLPSHKFLGQQPWTLGNKSVFIQIAHSFRAALPPILLGCSPAGSVIGHSGVLRFPALQCLFHQIPGVPMRGATQVCAQCRWAQRVAHGWAGFTAGRSRGSVGLCRGGTTCLPTLSTDLIAGRTPPARHLPSADDVPSPQDPTQPDNTNQGPPGQQREAWDPGQALRSQQQSAPQRLQGELAVGPRRRQGALHGREGSAALPPRASVLWATTKRSEPWGVFRLQGE